MNKKRILKRKFLATLLFSVIAAIGLILHGIFFDLDIQQIERLTLGGFILTFIMTFVALLILEKIFDLENHQEFKELEKRIYKLESRKK